MRFVIQRVSEASVEVNNKIVGNIDKGFLVLIAITDSDTKEIADVLINKMIKLRVFTDENDKMNLSLKDVEGKLLLVSQFTLYANCRKGNRPDSGGSAKRTAGRTCGRALCSNRNHLRRFVLSGGML